MALKEMEQIASSIIKAYGPIRIAIVHRLGDVGVGEISVVISVATPHRATSYDASRYAIDTLKAQVPILKKKSMKEEVHGRPTNIRIFKTYDQKI